MHKKTRIHLSFILLTLLLGMGLPLACYFYTQQSTTHGFVRHFPTHTVDLRAVTNLGFNSYYIAGTDQDQLYLGNVTDPQSLLVIDTATLDTHQLHRQLPKKPLIPGHVRWHIRGDQQYVTEGHAPIIAQTQTQQAAIQILDTTTYFLQASATHQQQLAFKIYNGHQSQLATMQLPNTQLQLGPKLLATATDGIFASDGTLVGTPHYFLYVYRYSNRFFKTNGSLQAIQAYTTIDPLHTPTIQIDTVGNTLKPAQPLEIINQHVCATDTYLLIHAPRKADNESQAAFNQYEVIDWYTVSDGQYQGSFYLQRFHDTSLKSIYLYGGTLYALFDTYLLSYHIQLTS